jgi:hypothetical protein
MPFGAYDHTQHNPIRIFELILLLSQEI